MVSGWCISLPSVDYSYAHMTTKRSTEPAQPSQGSLPLQPLWHIPQVGLGSLNDHDMAGNFPLPLRKHLLIPLEE